MKGKAPLPLLYGIEPKKHRNKEILWKRGAFEARAYASTQPVHGKPGERHWVWSWHCGGDDRERGSTPLGLEGAVSALEESILDVQAEVAWLHGQLSAIVKKKK